MYVGLHKISTEKTITFPVHRLVATAFIPNPDNLSEVNHIDKNTSNNDYTNLEWIEKSDNIKLGLGKPIWRCDKTTHQRIERYPSIAEAERIYTNGQRSNIIAVCKGRRKSAYGFFWEYDN